MGGMLDQSPFAAIVLFVLIGLLVDLLLGDPRWLPHPVIGIGRLISLLEKRFYPPPGAAPAIFWQRGALVAMVVVTVTALVAWAAMALIAWLSGGASMVMIIAGGIALGVALASRSLAEAGREIQQLLEQGQLEEARKQLSYIVGRDTAHLDESEIVRATVETVAENTVDGIVSPLFYAFLAGVPGAYAYKAVNTLDSMIAYRNERYQFFGTFAARLDDVANYLPARLTGFCMIVAGALLGHPVARMINTWRRDAAGHPSPNSGIPEAVTAGALGVQLGGQNSYGGVVSYRATMGDPLTKMQARHIGQTIQLMALTTVIVTIVGIALLYAGLLWLGR
ncbi:adenosylcobinamide-phosphate synthase CbiB [Heliophilum fasciatum]|uniref:Cobalamin biosynthesis protein CobD n=1 Tax=Heliophilum fasciatum TaxID=35700 RepID=A0A4R2RWJ0_9FIRM|nr:adenosylcobinamide-phosphate synthase CbiB [Heliophilum fasciatum]MCW2278540.1 adenosylcobinamide-phosphate synthase [Heliophilum fasciatum]TCP63495.1 adenosylcobinamide-phosphate synthase [Heliophilum fasciatum]